MKSLLAAAIFAALGFCAPTAAAPDPSAHAPTLARAPAVDNGPRGKYLLAIAGCNDCHTKGWDSSHGMLATSEWLTGNDVGFRGPWGTTYPENLRLSVQERGETAWITMIKSRQGLPPMPWASVHALTDDDARAVYEFIKSLGPKGVHAPAALEAGVEPKTAYVVLTPRQPGVK